VKAEKLYRKGVKGAKVRNENTSLYFPDVLCVLAVRH